MEDEFIKELIEKAFAEVFKTQIPLKVRCYDNSLKYHNDFYFVSAGLEEDYLCIISGKPEPWGFSGTVVFVDDYSVKVCAETSGNMKILQTLFPFTKPSCSGRNKSTFGVGDRLGFAGVGHLKVFKNTPVIPVLAQQSMRELDLTGRTYTDVITAAAYSVFKSGFEKPWIADGDHLKTERDVLNAIDMGCTMITADLSDYIDFSVSGLSKDALKRKYEKLESVYRERIEKLYHGRMKLNDCIVLDFSEECLALTALTYKKAIEHAKKLFDAATKNGGKPDFEISIDETDLPTTLESHYFIAKELECNGVKFTAIAPRFVGEFQKGIDYIGDLTNFEKDFSCHSGMASMLGYKISVHSSSDKFSAYPIIGRSCRGSYHLKTSGTNWLLALETVAEIDPVLFRKIFAYAYEVFPAAKAYYHVTPDMGVKTDLAKLTDDKLVEVFNNPTDRQVLHVSYGEMFRNRELKEDLFHLLKINVEIYWKKLEEHIAKHITLLKG